MIKVDKENVIPARLPRLLFGWVEAISPPVISLPLKGGEELHSAKNVLNNTPPGQTNFQTKQDKNIRFSLVLHRAKLVALQGS